MKNSYTLFALNLFTFFFFSAAFLPSGVSRDFRKKLYSLFDFPFGVYVLALFFVLAIGTAFFLRRYLIKNNKYRSSVSTLNHGFYFVNIFGLIMMFLTFFGLFRILGGIGAA